MVNQKILVSIATYNERENLRPLIEAIHRELPQAEVLVIDDNSPDGTGELASRMAREDPRIRVLHRTGKLGLGTAILAGMRFAVRRNYDLFINMDGDFSHDPRYLRDLVAMMDRVDVAIGSRYVRGGGTSGWPLSRRLMSHGVNWLVRLLMGIPARDTSGGYRCYRVAALRKVAEQDFLSFGYSFQEEMLYRCYRAGCRIGETPILFRNRTKGASKVDPREVVRSLGVLCYLGLRASFGLE